jgi:transcriptional regulator with XRE-family HTH domain
MSKDVRSKTISQREFREKVLAKYPEYVATEKEHSSKEGIARSLTAIRVHANLTQTQLAERAGWSKSYVSRLESPFGGIPDSNTLRRFADACGVQTAVVFVTPTKKGLHVVAGTTVGSAESPAGDVALQVAEQNLALT